ncbi:MAG: hypothetical protein HY600_01870 [Candidatus Omnitrophica bacterium]|nr:hypothetical protein [Candidatus Omnitrophota bacterium]
MRNIRAELRIPVAQAIPVQIAAPSASAARITPYLDDLRRLVRAGQVTMAATVERAKGSAVAHVGSMDIVIPLAGVVDLDAERQRIQRRVEELQGLRRGKQGRLNNEQFRAKAPAEIIAQEEEALRTVEQELAKWSDSLARLT